MTATHIHNRTITQINSRENFQRGILRLTTMEVDLFEDKENRPPSSHPLQSKAVILRSKHLPAFRTSFLRPRVDFSPQMGLVRMPRGIILELFWRRCRRVGSSGRPRHRKTRFLVDSGCLLVCFWSLFWVLRNDYHYYHYYYCCYCYRNFM